ncbi:MAG: sulfotransferase family protein [Saprospiraceae bacterium]|nr:sulfotransferase family protein [Saprospiraceae bacterium]
MDQTIRISAWCGPRNLSTALMYAFDNRQDCIAFDEPLYAYYLLNSPARAYHPGAEDIISNMEGNPKNLIDFMLGDFPMPVVFFKQMTHHLLDIDRAFMEKMKNIILTRDPFDMIPSFAKVVPNLTIEDIGYKDQLALKEYLNSKGQDVLVVDSKNCKKTHLKFWLDYVIFCGIPFDEKMLKWERLDQKILMEYGRLIGMNPSINQLIFCPTNRKKSLFQKLFIHCWKNVIFTTMH